MGRGNARRDGPTSHGELLDLIRSLGPVSRVELATRTGLTQGAVSIIVRRLLDDGLVHEVGHQESTGGKRRTLLEIKAEARYSIGIHIGRESIIYVLTDMGGGVIARQSRPGAGDVSPDRVVQRLATELALLIDRVSVDRTRIVGVGVVVPGPIDVSRGVMLGSPALQHWTGYPLRDELARRTQLLVLMDKDATAAAIGEFWGGHVAAPSTFACVYMGTGIGSGVLIDGAVYRGASSNAGEVGHVTLDVHGPACFCGNRGCVETFAAPPVVVERARRGALADRLGPSTSVARDFAKIGRWAATGDEHAVALIDESADYLAAGMTSLVNILDLDEIILAGPAFDAAGSIYVGRIRRALGQRMVARDAHGVDVRMSVNPRDAAAVGASALVLQAMLAPRAPITRSVA